MKKNSLDKIIPIIAGPTASGKSSLAIEICKNIGGEIISADSRQVYNECLIGTARATEAELDGVKIHLSGHKNIQEEYSVGIWLNEVKQKIDELLSKNITPVIAGGTPFYIYSLLNGIFCEDEDTKVSMEFRESLIKRWETESEVLFEDLKRVDEKWAQKLESNDKQRILRGLEYFYTNNKKLSDSFENHKNIFENYNFKPFILQMDREILYNRINQRVDKMLELGLEQEVTTLYKKYGDFSLYNSLKSVGYFEWIPYFNKEYPKEKVIELIKRNSRRYAKRQMTFFNNKFPNVKYINILNCKLDDVLNF